MIRFQRALMLCRFRGFSTRSENGISKFVSSIDGPSIQPKKSSHPQSTSSTSSSSQPTNKSRKPSSHFVSSFQRSRAPRADGPDSQKKLLKAVEHLRDLVTSGRAAEARAYSMSFCVSRAAAGVTNSSAEEWSLFLRHSLTACLILSDFAGASEIWSLVERSAKSEISSFTASMRDFEALLSVAAVSGSRQDATQIMHKMKRLNLNVVNNRSNENSSSSSSISSIALWPPSSSCVAFAMQNLARNGIPYRSISLFEDHFSNAQNDDLDKDRLSLALCTLAASAATLTTNISSSSYLKQGQLLLDLADEAWKSLQAAYSLHDDSHLSSQIPVAAHCALIEAARRSQSKDIAALWLDRFRKGLAMRNKERDLKNRMLDNATTPLANSQWGPDTFVSSLPFSSSSSSSIVTTLQTPRLFDFVDDIVRVSNHPLSPFVSAARTFLDSLPQSPDNGADRVIEIFQLAVKDGVPVDDSGWWDDLLIVTATAEALSGRSAQGIASLQIRNLLKRAANDAESNIAAERPTSSRPWHKMAFPLVRCAGMFRNSPNHQGAEIENLAGDVLSCLRLITGRVPRMIHEARAASAADAGDVDSALLVIDSLAEDKVAASPYMFESVFEACLKAQSGHALGRASAQYALARFVASGMHPTPRISALLKRIDERFVAEEEIEKEARRALSISKLRRRGLRGSRIINQRFGGRQRSELMEDGEDDAAGDSVETKERLNGEMNTISSSDSFKRPSSESVIPSNEESLTEKKKEVEKEDLSSVGSQVVKPEESVAVALPSSEDNDELSAFRSALQREELENKEAGFSIHDRSDEEMEMEEEVEDLNIPLNDDELARFSIIRASRDCGLRLNNRDSRILRALKAADEQDSGFEEADELKSDDSSVDGEGGNVMQYSEEVEDDEVVLDGHKPLPAYMLGGSSSSVEDHSDNNVREAVATSSSKDAAPSRESSAKQLARAFAQRRRNVTGLEEEET